MKRNESFDDRIIKKLGKIEYYEDFNKKNSLETEPAVFKYDRSFFALKGQKLD